MAKKYDDYYIGKTKNNYGRPINCNGVTIYASTGYVTIATFDHFGKPKRPKIQIDDQRFSIEEWFKLINII